MSDPDAAPKSDPADLARLAQGLGLISQLAESVSRINRHVISTDMVAEDLAAMAFAACEAELRSMTAIRNLVNVVRETVQNSGDSERAKSLLEALRELDIAEDKIATATKRVLNRTADAADGP